MDKGVRSANEFLNRVFDKELLGEVLRRDIGTRMDDRNPMAYRIAPCILLQERGSQNLRAFGRAFRRPCGVDSEVGGRGQSGFGLP